MEEDLLKVKEKWQVATLTWKTLEADVKLMVYINNSQF